MELSDKDTGELENILTDELVGPNPGLFMSTDDENGTLKEKVDRFFRYMSDSKDLREEFHDTILNSWGMMGSDKPKWLDYYKGVLIKEIRDIRIKKLINNI